MSELIAPESRVFHIARECYVVYLGNEQSDIRPFLRIGNSRDLTDEIHKVTSTVVITDNHVGNSLLEILNVPRCHGRYLGDTDVVETMKRFFESFDLPTEELADYRRVKDGEGRHTVWFYSSGNIHLRYDDKVIFDLHKREKQDRHFVRLFEEAKTEFYRNPFRYIRQDFSEAGIILTGGNAFWFEAGELLSLAAHPGFVAKLMGQGVDPDFITTMIYNLEEDEMDSSDAAVYIGLLKRVRQRRKKLRVITTKPELQRKLKLLFPLRGGTPATMDVADVSGKQKAKFHDSIISPQKDGWLIHRAGIPDVLFDGEEIDKGLSIDIAKGKIRCRTGTADVTFNIPNGYPIRFVDHGFSEVHLADKYAVYVLNNIKNTLRPEEAEIVTALDNYLQEFRDDVAARKTSVSSTLQQAARNAKDILRGGEIEKAGLSWFYFSNVCAIASIIRGTLPDNHPLSKNGQEVFDALETMWKQLPPPDAVYPFFGDLCLGDKPLLLWRTVKRNFTAADFTAAAAVHDSIHRIASPDETAWHDDRDRLLKLIRSLREGNEGPLSQRQLALLSDSEHPVESAFAEEETPIAAKKPVRRKPLEEKKPTAPRKPAAAKKPPEVRKTVETKKPAESSVRSGGYQERTIKSAVSPRSHQRSGSRRFSPWLLLALLPLLFLGAVIWDFSGEAPWGRILRSGISDPPVALDRDEAAQDVKDRTPDTDDRNAEKKDGAEDKTEAVVRSDGGTDADADGDGVPMSGMETSSNTEGSAAGTDDDRSAADGTDFGQQVRELESPDDQAIGSVEANEVLGLGDVQAYLDVDGRAVISEVDIHLAANEIAVLNGYKDLDYRVFTGDDPDWIYPGNNLMLPDDGSYIVSRGDTIWFLAVREIRLSVERDLKKYDQAVAILDDVGYDTDVREDAVDTLRTIARDGRAASLRVVAEKALTARGL